MNRSLQLLRLSFAIVLTMVVSLLPHHHHHGEPCLVFDKCLTHEHHNGCSDDDAPILPCNESSCYLQATKFFTQMERLGEIHPLHFDLVVPDEIDFFPNAYISHHRGITELSYPLFAGNQKKHYLRGPPIY